MKTETLETIDFASIAANEQRAEKFRLDCFRALQFSPAPGLLSAGTTNAKLRKSGTEDYRIVSLSLSHGSESGISVCPSSTAECRKLCVGSAGLSGVWPTISASRARKTIHIMNNRQPAIVQLVGELENERQKSERDGTLLLARLNCFSDLPWETAAFGMVPQLFLSCGTTGPGGVLFYDYTAILARVSNPQRPANYSLCGSWKGHQRNILGCHELLMGGFNVSVPFGMTGSYTGPRSLMQSLPETFSVLGDSFHVVDGDLSDLRAFDPGPRADGRGNVIGLRFKSSNTATRNEGLKSEFVVMVTP